jgi:hypothetical protein
MNLETANALGLHLPATALLSKNLAGYRFTA